MRKLLDSLYQFSGAVAGISILGICCLVSAQIVLNLSARLLGPGFSYTIPSYADFAGFMLATASFMGLAYTLRHGGHIRVTLVTQRLSQRTQFITEAISLILAVAVCGYALWYFGALVSESWRYGDMSPGIVAIPLWIPQTIVAGGLAVLLIALLDTLADSLRSRKPVLSTPDEV